ncbi:type II toxin-antitoxin system VapC family toxin [Thermithiobacillus plumbiphilus]|uniref:Type II toxin-antitoxin system VapC family toxin n=1 Tax=Thermithiobacillus plumbiphilus TaxID=1729899 RepID=A0ABU9D4I6_9PROT
MIVLDTHIWHWWINQIPDKLTPGTLALIEEADELGVSAISCFEMAWLARHGRIDLGMPFEDWLRQVEEADVVLFLPVTPWISARAVALPVHHKDPQDRLIIASALHYEARLLSFDAQFPLYQELDNYLITKNL